MPKSKRSGKVRDKWREKRWVTVLAPAGFERASVAYIPITNEETAVGRVIETTLFDLTRQDPQQNMLLKLHFQITGVEGNVANTVLKGEEYSREYLRSLVRRGASMVNFVRDYKTKNNAIVRVYVVAFTIGRINSSRKHEIRLAANKVVADRTAAMTYEQFAQEAVKQTLARELYEKTKAIAKIRHIGIRKIKLIKSGEGMAIIPSEAVPTAEEEEAMEGEGEDETEDEAEAETGAKPVPRTA
jgi:small subunit ribosomal protein S3Ae